MLWLVAFAACSGSVTAPAPAPMTRADQVVDFVDRNRRRSALLIVRSGQELVAIEPDRMMPLASTLKLAIAIEFARQVAAGRLAAGERVMLSELDRFHIPGTDGDAHPAWHADAARRGRLTGNATTLGEVARGMIAFSSNANADYLLRRLGPERVDSGVSEAGVARHDPLVPLAGALLLVAEPRAGSEAELLARLRALDAREWRERAIAASERLAADSSLAIIRSLDLRALSLERQRVWSDRLPRSTAREYAMLAARLAARSSFAPAVHDQLDPLLEGLLENPANRAWLAHAGMKNGSTAFVLTEVAYFVQHDGTSTAYAIFFDDLSLAEGEWLGERINDFRLGLLTDAAFRARLSVLR